MKTLLAAVAATALLSATAGSANAMMASTKYCIDSKYEIYGPATAMQMCSVPTDELSEVSTHLADRVQQDREHGIIIGELPPASSYTERAAAFEISQVEVARRAEIRSHYPQPHETVIAQRLNPSASPSPVKRLQPSDKIASTQP